MTTIVKIGIGAAVIATVVAIVPALKGPYNRAKLAANEKLNDEFVVDNYKAEYVNLYDKRAQVLEAINKFKVEQAVATKKLDAANKEANVAKSKLLAIGTDDLKAFDKAKTIYETLTTKVNNFTIMANTYSNALVKLNRSLELIDSNMTKAKLNVDTLQAKKTMVDAIKGVNKSIENIDGVGDSNLGIAIEKLDDNVLRESIKLEALSETSNNASILTKEDAQSYINSIK